MRWWMALVLVAGCHEGALPNSDEAPPDLGVATVPPDFGVAPETIAVSVGAPSELAVDRANHQLYWNDQIQGLVVRAATDGSERRTVDQGDTGYFWLSVGKDAVYWSGFETMRIRSTPRGTIAPTTLLANVYVRAMIVDDSALTFADDNRIALYLLDGSGTLVNVVTATDPGRYQWLVKTDGGALFVISLENNDRFVLNQLVDGALQPTTKIPGAVAAYFSGALYLESDTAITRLALFDDSLQTIGARAAGNERGGQLATDSAFLYFVDTKAGTIRRASFSDGTVQTLASGQSRPEGIAVDDQYVYWTTFGDGLTTNGTIVRLALP